MRLSKSEIEAIKDEALASFGRNVSVYLFGSRTDDMKKGGDIDLIIKPELSKEHKYFKNKIEFLINLKNRIGDQKIDVLIAKENDRRNIISLGIANGNRIC